ncbi:N-acetyl-6-hydroxytryptophan oxidase ivoB like protein [Verticillium longisporum]|nr:N-acetyl-6-hydroxytryptophan oxidase ivoB like protein [Verticillium longisporum]
MRFVSILTSVALTSVALATPAVHPRDDASDEAQVSGLVEYIKTSVLKSLDDREAKLRKHGEEASCHGRNVVFRREYGSLSEEERLSYVNAIKCLQTLPPRTPANVSSGAKSRVSSLTISPAIDRPDYSHAAV